MIRALPVPVALAVALLASPAIAQLGGPLGSSQLSVTATGGSAARSLADRFADSVNVKDFGAKGNAAYTGYCTIAAGSTALACSGVAWSQGDVGKAIIVHGAGPNATPLLTTIAGVTDATHATLAAAASSATPLYYAEGGPWEVSTSQATVSAPGAGYAPGDVLTLAGGARYTVENTAVAAATVAAAGSGGANGTCTVTGTSGVSTTNYFTASVTIASGGISAVNAIASGSAYWTNPTVPSAEPVTGCGLSGAKLNLSMGVLNVNWTAAGSYAAAPSTPMATTDSGSGIGATLSPGFWQSGTTSYGSDDWPAISAAYAAAVAAHKPLYLPSGGYLLYSQGSASLTPSDFSPCVEGEGPSTRRSETNSGATFEVVSTQAPLFTIGTGFCLRGIAINYPMQDGTSATPIAYPPVVSVSPTAQISTVEDVRISGAYDCFELQNSTAGSALGQAKFTNNRFNCYHYGFAAYNGTADIIHFIDDTWTYADQEPLAGGAGSDPFGLLSKYVWLNGEVFHVDVAAGGHQTIDGLYLTNNFAHGYRYAVHVVSGGITLSKWTGNYWEVETNIQTEAAGFITSTTIYGDGSWAQARDITRGNPNINLLTTAGTAAGPTDLVIQGYDLLHTDGDGLDANGSGVGMLTISGGHWYYWGQQAAASVTHYAIDFNDTGGGSGAFSVASLVSDPVNMPPGHTFYHFADINVPNTTISGNIIRNGYVGVLKQGYAGNGLVNDNTASGLQGPFFVFDNAGATTYIDVGLNATAGLPQSNIWHPSQRDNATGIAAHTGGGQPNATLLAAYFDEVTTVATAADSVKLPPAIGKGCIVATNSGANAMQVYGSNSDTINGVASGTGVAVAAGKTGQWCSPASGRWVGGTLN